MEVTWLYNVLTLFTLLTLLIGRDCQHGSHY